MTLYRWRFDNPMEEFLKVQNEMSRLMREFTSDYATNSLPPFNVYDDGETFHVRAELAGLDKDKLDISVAGDVLTIKAERAPLELRGSYHRRERGWDAFNRSLTLPDTVDVTKVKATYGNGVLDVALPRVPEAKPRKIALT